MFCFCNLLLGVGGRVLNFFPVLHLLLFILFEMCIRYRIMLGIYASGKRLAGQKQSAAFAAKQFGLRWRLADQGRVPVPLHFWQTARCSCRSDHNGRANPKGSRSLNLNTHQSIRPCFLSRQ